MTTPLFTPYSTAATYFTATPPTYLNTLDAQRIQSYQLYDEIYWNIGKTFRLAARGGEDNPIYIPSGRIIVDTAHRYVGAKLGFVLDPAVGTPQEQQVARDAFSKLFARERFLSKYTANKRSGLIHGDWLFHIVADPAKPQGSRISIYTPDPATYFPIYDADNVDRLIGVDLIEQIVDDKKTRIRKQRYLKTDAGAITVEEAIYDPEKAEIGFLATTPGRPVRVIKPPTVLPGITAIPVYHIKNFEEPNNPFGSSEMRGLERLMAAVNQSISDEELALALEGLGVYATDAGPPVDDDGRETNWVIGPGRVLEIAAGTSFQRVGGVGSVTPYQDHIAYLESALKHASGTPDAAMGKVDVTVAESGISLALQLAPMLSKAEDADLVIVDTMAQMFFDLRNWFKVYEATPMDNVSVIPTLGDKIPVDRKQKFAELDSMYKNNIISASYYRAEAAKMGYDFPVDIGLDVVAEKAAMTDATNVQDPFSARMEQELTGTDLLGSGAPPGLTPGAPAATPQAPAAASVVPGP